MSSDIRYKLIFLTGVDGSGKTFLAKKVIAHLKAQGIATVHVWSRFNNYLSKPLLAYARLVGLNYYEENGGVKVGYHDFQEHKIFSCIFVMLQLIDVWFSAMIKFWIPCLIGNKIVISDRGPYDTLIDVSLDTGFESLPETIWGKLFYKSIPFSHKVFFICRDKNKILESRPDIKYDRKFSSRLDLYTRYKTKLGFGEVSNNHSVEHSVEQILKEILCEEKETACLDKK